MQAAHSKGLTGRHAVELPSLPCSITVSPLGRLAPSLQVSQLFLRPDVMLLALSCTLRAEFRRDLALCVSSLGPNLQADGLGRLGGPLLNHKTGRVSNRKKRWY